MSEITLTKDQRKALLNEQKARIREKAAELFLSDKELDELSSMILEATKLAVQIMNMED